MMRTLSFPAEIGAAPGVAPHLFLPLSYDPMPPAQAAAHKAQMAHTIPWNTVQRAARLLAAAGGEAMPVPPFVHGEAIVIPLPASATAQAWHAAVILNLVDFAVAAEDPELLLIQSASLRAPALAGLTVPAAFDALAGHLETCRGAMTARLPKGFYVDDYAGAAWPDDPDGYDFALTQHLSRALTPAEIATASALAEDAETIIAWMAYTVAGDARTWTDAGKMVFAGETVVTADRVEWNASRPPTDIAPSLLLFEAALARMGAATASWGVTIRDAI